jgi:RimJ/RimL family protein N-acetyltransferase
MRYPLPRAAEEEWLKGQVAAFQSFGPVMYAIETKEGAYIGNINFHLVFPESRKARLGISIGEKAYWSKGYGADALVTLLRFGFDEMNLHRVDLTVDEDNPRAIACYEKVGFVHEGRMRQARYARGAYRDSLVMGILRDEFATKWGASG